MALAPRAATVEIFVTISPLAPASGPEIWKRCNKDGGEITTRTVVSNCLHLLLRLLPTPTVASCCGILHRRGQIGVVVDSMRKAAGLDTWLLLPCPRRTRKRECHRVTVPSTPRSSRDLRRCWVHGKCAYRGRRRSRRAGFRRCEDRTNSPQPDLRSVYPSALGSACPMASRPKPRGHRRRDVACKCALPRGPASANIATSGT